MLVSADIILIIIVVVVVVVAVVVDVFSFAVSVSHYMLPMYFLPVKKRNGTEIA